MSSATRSMAPSRSFAARRSRKRRATWTGVDADPLVCTARVSGAAASDIGGTSGSGLAATLRVGARTVSRGWRAAPDRQVEDVLGTGRAARIALAGVTEACRQVRLPGSDVRDVDGEGDVVDVGP